MPTRPYVFISYSSNDRDFVSKLADDLEMNGVQIWWDHHRTEGIRIADDWEQKLQSKLHECTHLLVILTATSVNSKMVRAEIQTAFDDGKLLIPLLLEKVVIPLQLKPNQYLDMRDTKTYETGIQQLTHFLLTGKMQLGEQLKNQTDSPRRQWRSSLLGILSVLIVIVLGGFILNAGGVIRIQPPQAETAIEFLIDASMNMQGKVDNRPRQEIVSSIIRAIVYNDIITDQYWLGLRTAGGGGDNECRKTDLISEMKGTTEIAAKDELLKPLEQVTPNGNTAYLAGINSMVEDLKRSKRRVVFIFLGSDKPSYGCEKADPIDIPQQLISFERQNVSVAVCAFTLLGDVGKFEGLKRRLKDQGIDCVQNIDDPDNIGGYVDLAIRMVKAAAQDEPTPPPYTFSANFPTVDWTAAAQRASTTPFGTRIAVPPKGTIPFNTQDFNSPEPSATTTQSPTNSPTLTATATYTATVTFTASATPTSTLTFTPSPTATITPIPPPPYLDVLFSKDFENYKLDDIDQWGGGWSIQADQQDTTNKVFCATTGGSMWNEWSVIKGQEWSDYSAEMRVQLVNFDKIDDLSGNIQIAVRIQPRPGGQGDPESYYIFLDPVHRVTSIQHYVSSNPVEMATSTQFIDAAKWHLVRVEAQGGNFYVFIDGKQVLSVQDNNYLSSGTIGVQLPPNTTGCVDDIVVRSLIKTQSISTNVKRGRLTSTQNIFYKPDGIETIGKMTEGSEVFVLEESADKKQVMVRNDADGLQGWLPASAVEAQS